MLAADAIVMWQALPHQPLPGETIEVSIAFDNTGASAGDPTGQDEDGIENIEVTLTGITEEGVAVKGKTTTNARGYYVFGQLQPGTYSVVEGKTESYFDTAEQWGTQGGRVENDAFRAITVAAAKPGEMYNFGEYRRVRLPAKSTSITHVDYELLAVAAANAKYKLSVGVSDKAALLKLKTGVNKLSPTRG